MTQARGKKVTVKMKKKRNHRATLERQSARTQELNCHL